MLTSLYGNLRRIFYHFLPDATKSQYLSKSSHLSYCLAILTLTFKCAVLEHIWFGLTHCTESRNIQIGRLAILAMQMIFLYLHFFLKI